jgi:sugar O-acyltransferase (sialic acid O-acetyltransferase NeuD family)
LRVIVVGAGGHGQVVADILRAARAGGRDVEVIGYLDDRKAVHGHTLVNARVLGPATALNDTLHDAVVVAIGDNKARAAIARRLVESGARLATAVHPAAVVAMDVSVGDGSMLCAGAVVNTGTVIGRGVILNTACSVDHHTTVGDYAHIAPGVHMGGEVTVGEGALVGIGAVVLPRVTIGRWAIVGAGAVVTRNVPDGAIVIGNPARPLSGRIPQSV